MPDASVRMISTVINPKGVGVTSGFKRVDEYIFIARFGDQRVSPTALAPLGSVPVDKNEPNAPADVTPKRIGLDWQTARRRDLASVRHTRPSQFYPVYVNRRSGLIEAVGEPIPHEMDRKDAPSRQGCVSVFLSLIHISEPTRPY